MVDDESRWIGSLPLAQIELFTRRVVRWDCSRGNVAARLNATICDSTLADFEEDERSFLVELLAFVRPLLLSTSTWYSAFAAEKKYYWDEHRLCLARLTFCHSLISLNYPLSFFFRQPSAPRWNLYFALSALKPSSPPYFSQTRQKLPPSWLLYTFSSK